MARILAVPFEDGLVAAAKRRAGEHRRLDEGAGLERRDTADVMRIVFRPLGEHVEHLTAADPCGADGPGEYAHRAQEILRGYAFQLCQRKFEGLRQQRVAREDGESLSKKGVIRRFPTAHVVVVHTWQVVVDQRRRMEHFKAKGHRQSVFSLYAASLSRRKAEYRP